MTVRITRPTPDMWYKDITYLNTEYKVQEDRDFPDYWLVIGSDKLIHKLDCEIV